MRFLVRPIAGGVAAGGVAVNALARVDDGGGVEVFSGVEGGWIPGAEEVRADIAVGRRWSPLAAEDVEETARALMGFVRGQVVGPGCWVSVRPDEYRVLIRSDDGRSVQGYAVTSGRWEVLPYQVSPALADPALWEPVAEDRVAEVQAWLHLQWDLKQQAAFDAQAPRLVDPELTEVALREGIVYYIVEILKRLPDGLIVGSQAPESPPLSCGSGPLGPRGAWNFEVGYWVWGYPAGANDTVFDAFKALFDRWGWSYDYESSYPDDRRLRARTSTERKHSYHVVVSRFRHGGISMRWTTPYYTEANADRDSTGMRMPSVITKDGIKSWEPPVYRR